MILPIKLPFFEINFVNPLFYPFDSIGINLFVLLVHVPIVGGFGMAAYYVIRYLKKFYGQRPIPEEWKCFWWAMIWGTIHELTEVVILYQWVVGQLLLIAFFIVQIIAGLCLVRGSYLLAKKYTMKK